MSVCDKENLLLRRISVDLALLISCQSIIKFSLKRKKKTTYLYLYAQLNPQNAAWI